MKYLAFTKKTKTADGKFIGVFEANDAKQAKQKAEKNNFSFSAATTSEINWLKKDKNVRISKTNSLPIDFEINNEIIIKI